MPALVTGAAGFLGSHVAKRLAESGELVRGMVQSSSHSEHWKTNGVTPFVGDLLDADAMMSAVRGLDTVFHCAAKIPGAANEDEVWNVNVSGTENLLRACVDAGVRRFVFVSTDSVYGDGDCPGATEDAPLNPEYIWEGNYPRSKLEGERLVHQYHKKHGLAYTIVRTCLMYGPGRCPGNEILLRWARSRVHLLIGGGKARMSLAYVTDVADLLILAASQSRAAGECYNVCDGVPYSRRDFLQAIAAASHRQKVLIAVPAHVYLVAGRLLYAALRPLHAGLAERFNPDVIRFFLNNHVADITKAKCELGYCPQVLLQAGLARLFDWNSNPAPVL